MIIKGLLPLMKLLIPILFFCFPTVTNATDDCFFFDRTEIEKEYNDYLNKPESKGLTEKELLSEIGLIGVLLSERKEKNVWASGVLLMEAAASKGHISSMSNLGLYFSKKDNQIRNIERSICWFKKAALRNDGQSSFALYTIYSQSESKFFNGEKAIAWLRKSAELDYSRGLCTLGVRYMNGEFVKQDRTKATGLFSKAATKGNQVCIGNLAQSYYYGEGVEKDVCKAKHWLEKLENEDERKNLRVVLSDVRNCKS